jgi:hypothetical protein
LDVFRRKKGDTVMTSPVPVEESKRVETESNPRESEKPDAD